MKKFLEHFNSLKYKFLFSSLAIMITFMVITTWLWYTVTYSDAHESASTYISEMLKVSNENLQVALRDINYVVASSASQKDYVIDILSKPVNSDSSDYELLQDMRKIQDYVTNLSIYKHYLKGIMISDLNGRSYVNGDMAPFEKVKSQDWFKKLDQFKNQSIFTSPHFYQDNDGAYEDQVISIVRPILYSNTVIGFVLADIRSSILNDIYNMNLKGKGTISIIDTETGEFIYKSQASLPIKGNNLKALTKKFTSDQGSFNMNLEGRDTLVIYNYSKLTHWTTIGIIPKEQLLAGYNKIIKTVFVLLFVFMIAGVVITYFTTSILTKNIMMLNKAIKALGKDNMDISVNIKSRDEIGQLYHQFNVMVIRIKELVCDIKHTESAKRKAELKALQAQINPHFLYNTLNTIKFLSIIQGAENIKNVSEALSTLMHINMDDRQFISVEEEIQYIRSYLSIQEYKFTNKFIYNILADEDIKNYMVLKLLLQPVIENALIHGIAPMKGQGILLIKLYKENDCLKLRVQDNGIGVDKSQIDAILADNIQSRGIGLGNVISRIRMNFGEDYGLSILSEAGLYTIFELTVPLIRENEVKAYV